MSDEGLFAVFKPATDSTIIMLLITSATTESCRSEMSIPLLIILVYYKYIVLCRKKMLMDLYNTSTFLVREITNRQRFGIVHSFSYVSKPLVGRTKAYEDNWGSRRVENLGAF